MAKKDEPFSKRFVESLFGSSSHALPEDEVREYIIHRISNGAHLRDVLEEDYVRRNCSQAAIDKIEMDPRLVHAARENMERTFNSGELDPGGKV